MARPTRSEPVLSSDLGAAGDGAGEILVDMTDPAERVQAHLWWAAAVVWRRRWWILLAAVLTGAVAVYATLQIPNRYRAETRVLLPESGGGLASLLGRNASAASALLGGGGGSYTRYLAILTARTTMEDIVTQFDLVSVYETEEAIDPVAKAVGKLGERASFDVSLDFDYLAVKVLDEDPGRAAQMANAFVGVLNREHTVLNRESASTYRVYLGQRLERAESDLDSLFNAQQQLQERYGLVEPEAQSSALMESLSSAQSMVSQAEVEVQMLQSELGSENPQTQTAMAGLAAARAQRDQLTSGASAMMPVPIGQLPAVGRQYAEVQQGLLLQKAVLEALQPLYEQSLLNERREADAVQVLDTAVPPTRKAEPGRTVIVLASAISAFILALVLFLAVAVVRRWAPVVAARLRAAGA